MAVSSGTAPLFILSFRHRDELTGTAERAGWQPIAARRADNAEGRFIASGSQVAVVDARGALAEGREAVRTLADPVEANASAMLVLISRNDEGALDELLAAGATHFLVSPFSEQHFISAVQYARRHSERVGGSRPQRRGETSPSWRWQPGSTTIELSPSLARKAGLGEEAGQRISLMDLFRKLDPEGRRAARGAIDRLLATGEATAFAHADVESEGRLAHHIRVEGEGDVIGRTEAMAPTEPDSSRDPMTGIRDAAAARAWIAQELERGEPIVLMLIAVSRFDTINAAFGRGIGDSVLQAAARRIERIVTVDGRRRLISRLAGAEFAIALAAPTTLAEGRFLAGQLVETLGRPFLSGDHVVSLGCRAGVAAAIEGDDGAALLRRASAALAEAKAGDSGPVRVFDDSGTGGSLFADQLDIDLRRALDRDEIDIVFQPQVAIASRRIIGVEALARWHHPRFGELGAETLFNVAERSDYLDQLSDHIQQKALEIAAGWPPALASLRLSVNITSADIARPGFADQFLARVAEIGFERGLLTVEVTESGLIDDLAAAATLLARLREGGLRVAIDDFGTGYSSLAYLKALPLDYLKIDKKLSDDIAGSVRDQVVVRSVIEMARSLGLEVIAEGVETEDQLTLLAREGCTLYQGFLCAPALDTARLLDLVEGQRSGESGAQP